MHTFSHGDRVKRKVHDSTLYIYGVYLGKIYDFMGQPMCICVNPDVNEHAYFMARPEDLFPLDTIPGREIAGTLK